MENLENIRTNEFDTLINKMKTIHDKKCHDYAQTTDRFSNFRLSELSGIPAWHGILIRLGDKYSRLCEYAKKGSFDVDDEGLEDTFIDMANYALLGLMAYNDMRRKQDAKEEKIYEDKINPTTEARETVQKFNYPNTSELLR
jgi:hypothetical protein